MNIGAKTSSIHICMEIVGTLMRLNPHEIYEFQVQFSESMKIYPEPESKSCINSRGWRDLREGP